MIDSKVLRALLQRPMPDYSTNDEDDDGIEDEHPVKEYETGGDMVLLHDCSN